MKHDCVFGDDLDLNEISYVSEVFCSFLLSYLSPFLPLIFIRKYEISNILADSLANLPYDMSFQVLRELDRPIVYSLSPGTSVTPVMAKDVSRLVNIYRITGDDWDTWWDVKAHFDVTRSLNSFISVQNICISLHITLQL